MSEKKRKSNKDDYDEDRKERKEEKKARKKAEKVGFKAFDFIIHAVIFVYDRSIHNTCTTPNYIVHIRSRKC